MNKNKGLGRGLDALLGGNKAPSPAPAPALEVGERLLTVKLGQLQPGKYQPRTHMDQASLAELAESIKEHGIMQPILVRSLGADKFEIIAGERRWRAAQLAQLHEVPVVVREVTDSELLELAIIENIQRADLNPVEEAMGYRQLMDRFGHTQEKLAEALSKSRSYIANLLRLLSLPEAVLGWLREGKLTAGHARALITTDNPTELARQVIDKGLSVRETERLAQSPRPARAESSKPRRRPEKDADTRVLEQDLSANLRMQVVIDHQGLDGGSLIISYKSLDQLDQLCQILSSVR